MLQKYERKTEVRRLIDEWLFYLGNRFEVNIFELYESLVYETTETDCQAAFE